MSKKCAALSPLFSKEEYMPTLEDFEQELRTQAQAAGVSPEEYIRICRDFWDQFVKMAPDTVRRLTICEPDSRFQKAEQRITKKIAMGARRTYGSF